MNEGIEELIYIIRTSKYVEDVKEKLHELNFEFMDSDTVESFQNNQTYIEWEYNWHKKFQWMVRRYGHPPSLPRLEWNLLIGIRFLDYRAPKIIIYQKGKHFLTILKPWKVPIEVNAKKKKIPLTFPDEMSIQDRIDWRKSHRKFSSGKSLEKKELEYYLKYKSLIGNLDREFDHLD